MTEKGETCTRTRCPKPKSNSALQAHIADTKARLGISADERLDFQKIAKATKNQRFDRRDYSKYFDENDRKGSSSVAKSYRMRRRRSAPPCRPRSRRSSSRYGKN